MATVASMLNDLKRATARDDADAVAIMMRAINAGIAAAAALFQPPELAETGYLTASSASSSVPISLSRFLVIHHVYNATSMVPMWPLSLHDLFTHAAALPGNPRFYAIHGDTLYFAPTPSTDNTLRVHYVALPTRVSEATDTLPLDTHQDFVFAVAQAYVWAAFEEADSVLMWHKVAELSGLPFKSVFELQTILHKVAPYGNDIRGAAAPGYPANPQQ